jgi:hypothetical protein
MTEAKDYLDFLEQHRLMDDAQKYPLAVEYARSCEAEIARLWAALKRIAFEDELVYLGCADMPFCHDPHTNTKQCPVAVARAALEGWE